MSGTRFLQIWEHIDLIDQVAGSVKILTMCWMDASNNTIINKVNISQVDS